MKSEIKPLVRARASGLAGAVLATFISLCGCVGAQATSIIYTFSGVGSGDLGADAFNNASFTITSTADTSQIINPMPGILHVPDMTATISVSGVGSGTFDISTINVDGQDGNARVGFSDPVQNLAILFVENAAFATYDLNTPIGPLSGAPSFNSGAQFGTTAGNFSLTSVSTATFQATAVPEPGTISLFAVAGLSA
jgi:hypothetical protein